VLYGIKFVAGYLLGTDIAGRNLRVFPDDTFIASYPRSGNTWTRFLIANLVHPEPPVTFANLETIIPDASALSSRQFKRVPRPRLIKTHEYFEPRYRKVIYLVRDPRDVVLSLYSFRRKYRAVDDSYPIERYVADRFLPGDLDVSWGEHVGSWLGTRMNQPAPKRCRRQSSGAPRIACDSSRRSSMKCGSPPRESAPMSLLSPKQSRVHGSRSYPNRRWR